MSLLSTCRINCLTWPVHVKVIYSMTICKNYNYFFYLFHFDLTIYQVESESKSCFRLDSQTQTWTCISMNSFVDSVEIHVFMFNSVFAVFQQHISLECFQCASRFQFIFRLISHIYEYQDISLNPKWCSVMVSYYRKRYLKLFIADIIIRHEQYGMVPVQISMIRYHSNWL